MNRCLFGREPGCDWRDERQTLCLTQFGMSAALNQPIHIAQRPLHHFRPLLERFTESVVGVVDVSLGQRSLLRRGLYGRF